MIFDKDGAEGVEELEWGQDVALDEDGGGDCSGRPVTGTDWHFVEPLFEGKLACNVSSAGAAAHEHAFIHVHDVVRGFVRRGKR